MAGYLSFGDARNSPIALSLERPTERINSLAKIEQEKAIAKIRKDAKIAALKQFSKENATSAMKSMANTGREGLNARDRVTEEAFAAMAIAKRHQQVDFSDQQRQLQQIFGHGEKIWGTEMAPVKINNDLNPGKSDPWDETSSMFGAGPHSERSGLF